MKALLAATLLSLLAGLSSAVSIGNLLQRDWSVFKTMPTTTVEATAAGWGPLNGLCEPGMGVAWTQTNGSYPSEHKPMWLYFTPAGQASGVAMLFLNHNKKEKNNLIDQGFIVQYPGMPSGHYYVSVGFRSNGDSCSTSTSSKPLGDRLVIHPDGIAHSLPVTALDAWNRGWVRGSCFAGMGTHWLRDLSSPGSMTWQADQLLPVVTMYDEESANPTNSIQAIFFASTVVQQGTVSGSPLPPVGNEWEPFGIPDKMMCMNMCNSSCTFHGTSFYSTAHVYFNDRSRVTCHGGCQFACCGSNSSNFENRRLKRLG